MWTKIEEQEYLQLLQNTPALRCEQGVNRPASGTRDEYALTTLWGGTRICVTLSHKENESDGHGSYPSDYEFHLQM